MKVVCIGNSIVNGFPIEKGLCFAGLLSSRYGYDVVNKGVNGDTTKGIYERFDRDVISLNPDICMLLTGTNDFIGGLSEGEVFDNIRHTADKACDIKTMKMIVLTPLLTYPEMAEREWLPADYNMINNRLKSLANNIKKLDGCYTIDTQQAFADSGIKNSDAYIDGIHPTPQAHEFLAEYISDCLCELCNK